jgi:tetratricopeptide (TPR) repeat protein
LCGAFTSAVGCFERAIALARKLPATISVRGGAQRPGLVQAGGAGAGVLAFLGLDLAILGHLDEALSWADRALASGRSASAYELAIALWAAHWVNRFRGAEQIAQEHLAQLTAVASKHRFSLFLHVAGLFRALHLSEQGETAEGLASARQAFADRTALTRASPWGFWTMAYCCQRAGELDEALELSAKALETAKATGERWYETELFRFKGELLVSHRPRRNHEAEASFQQALALAREQQAKLWELRAATSLARLWRDQGKRQRARELLAPVYNWFTEGFDTLDLKEAKALLAELT